MSIPFFRHWRIIVDSVVSGATVNINQINFRYGGYAINASGLTYFASAGNPGSIFYDAVSTWSAGVGDYVGVSFDNPVCLNYVDISAGGPTAPKDFRLQYSPDRINWYTLATFADVTSWPIEGHLVSFFVLDYLGLNPQGDYLENEKAPFILYNNIFRYNTQHGSSSADDTADLYNPLIKYFYTCAFLPIDFTVGGTGKGGIWPADTFAITGVDQDGVLAVVSYYDDTALMWVDVATFLIPKNKTFIGTFPLAIAGYWRVTFSGDTPPNINYMALGKRLVLPRQVYATITPSPFNRAPNVRQMSNPNGQFTGKQLIANRNALAIPQTNCPADWYRRYAAPLQYSVSGYDYAAWRWADPNPPRDTFPFNSCFAAWRPDLYPNDCFYGWITEDFRAHNSGPNTLMSFSLNMTGVTN